MNQPTRLQPCALGLALGIVWGLSLFIIGLFASAGYWTDFVNSLGKYYYGYDASILGSMIGGLWGFIDFFIGGMVIAWLYNLFSKCFCRKQNEDNQK